MKILREHIIFKVLWFAIAAHIFNFSIDTPDANPECIAEDLSINDIESFSELVLENMLGFEDAVEEHDEPDNPDGTSLGVEKFNFYVEHKSFNKSLTFSELPTRKNLNSYITPSYYSHIKEILSPPPEA